MNNNGVQQNTGEVGGARERNAYRVSAGKTEVKRQLGRPRCR
jgi:hypothetical protein